MQNALDAKPIMTLRERPCGLTSAPWSDIVN
jgi:hypothetical protein